MLNLQVHPADLKHAESDQHARDSKIVHVRVLQMTVLQIGLAFDDDFEETALLVWPSDFPSLPAPSRVTYQAVTIRRPRPEPRLPREPGLTASCSRGRCLCLDVRRSARRAGDESSLITCLWSLLALPQRKAKAHCTPPEWSGARRKLSASPDSVVHGARSNRSPGRR